MAFNFGRAWGAFARGLSRRVREARLAREAPPPAPVQAPPTPEQAQFLAGFQRRRFRGGASTLLTGALGIPGVGGGTRRKTLLGE